MYIFCSFKKIYTFFFLGESVQKLYKSYYKMEEEEEEKGNGTIKTFCMVTSSWQLRNNIKYPHYYNEKTLIIF